MTTQTPDSKPRALIAMSGGVDSSVAAWLMQQAGYDCTGITMRLTRNETLGQSGFHTCCSEKDIEDAGLAQCFVAGEPHGDAGAVVARLLHQPRRHRAVHAAAHGDEGAGLAIRGLCGHKFSFGAFNTLR